MKKKKLKEDKTTTRHCCYLRHFVLYQHTYYNDQPKLHNKHKV